MICCPKSVQNKIFTTVQKLLDNEKLQLKQDNLIDLSEEGLKEDANLKKWYDKKVLNLLEEYDWVYKITADNYSILKVMEEIKRSGYAKKGIVLPYFKTLDHKESEAVKKSEKNFREFIKEFFKFNICVVNSSPSSSIRSSLRNRLMITNIHINNNTDNIIIVII